MVERFGLRTGSNVQQDTDVGLMLGNNQGAKPVGLTASNGAKALKNQR